MNRPEIFMGRLSLVTFLGEQESNRNLLQDANIKKEAACPEGHPTRRAGYKCATQVEVNHSEDYNLAMEKCSECGEPIDECICCPG
jgi:hypothetical protein